MNKFDIRVRFRRKKSKVRDRNLPDTQRPNLLKILQQNHQIKTIPLFDFNGNPNMELTNMELTNLEVQENTNVNTKVSEVKVNEISRNGICKPSQVWSKDFTYLDYLGKFIYVATLKDCFTKEIVGINISDNHNQELITKAFNSAISKYKNPEISHSDQGTEYRAKQYLQKLQSLGIQISMSAKGHPWENGHQESYYNYFKLELGNPNRFNSKGELVEAIYRQVYQYNNCRIHTSIKTTPTLKRLEWEKQNKEITRKYGGNITIST
jgi:hypothetical protein